ncbi:MAG: HD domain-containing protein [Spirochaetales bacterium]|nr:HD domain-containing protein [Spirochaetales bacterium]
MVKKAKAENFPYALAFIDVRMPPGWDGIETITRIWEIDPFIEVAICTAYADYSWDQIVSKLGYTDHIIIIKKPFEKIEIKQMATALIQKWNSATRARLNVKKLESNLQNQIEIKETIIEFANLINSLKSLDGICRNIIDFTANLIKSERISIMLPDEHEENLYIVKSIGIPDEIIDNTFVKTGEGIAGEVFTSGEKLIINNIEDSKYRKRYSSYDSFLCLPFVYTLPRKKTINLGVFNLTNKQNNMPFTKDEVTLVSYVVNTSAVALYNQITGSKREETLLGSIAALIKEREAHDHYMAGHSNQVSLLAKGIAEELGLKREEIDKISLAGLLHDIGKAEIPKSILSKQGKLTEKEYNLIKEHPAIGERILNENNLPINITDGIRHHHERLDGSGYPDRLKGEQISIDAKIIAVADMFDAMRSKRSYRHAIPERMIKKELMGKAGITLDPECVQALFSYMGI